MPENLPEKSTQPAVTPAVQTANEKIEKALVIGDLASLTTEERLQHVNNVAKSLDLNPLTKPFDYIETRDGKLLLYANKCATDQLRNKRGISVEIIKTEERNGIFIVTAKAKTLTKRFNGASLDTELLERVDVSTGAVPVKGKNGDALANAYMKAETKAKRRVTLSICGLGILDESELDTIPRMKDVESTQAKPPTQGQRVIPPKKEQSLKMRVMSLLVENGWSKGQILEYREGRWPDVALEKDLGENELLTWFQEVKTYKTFDGCVAAREEPAKRSAGVVETGVKSDGSFDRFKGGPPIPNEEDVRA